MQFMIQSQQENERISGVNIRRMVSFTNCADKMPREKDTKHSKRKEFLVWVTSK